MKKKIISAVLLLILSLSLMGCGGDNISREITRTSNNRFVKVGDNYDVGVPYNIYYDSVTNIVYLVSDYSNGSGITALYNTNGRPMTLEEYKTTR